MPAIIPIILAVLGLFFGHRLLTSKGPRRLRVCLGLVATLCALGFHYVSGGVPMGGHWAAPIVRPQYHEFFHYLLGAKYFEQVGYEGLYAAAIVADYEDDASNFNAQAGYRDLRSNRIVSGRGALVSASERIKARFLRADWIEFKADLAVFRAQFAPGYWHNVGVYYDHGYNGTPVLTALLQGLASQTLLSTEDFILVASLLDSLLIFGLACILVYFGQAELALMFLLFFYLNPFNANRFIGGSFLRYIDFVAMALALRLWTRGRRATGGALVAAAACLRVFPVLLPAVYLAHAFLRKEGAATWKCYRSAGYVGLATTALLVGPTFLMGGGGVNAWTEFGSNMRRHADIAVCNQIGLNALAAWDFADDGDEPCPKTVAEAIELEQSIASVAASRAPLAWCLKLLSLLGLIPLLGRLSVRQLPAVWLLLLWALVPLSNYYWTILALLPLSGGFGRRLQQHLMILMLVLALLLTPGLLGMSQADSFAWASGTLWIGLLSYLWLAGRADACAPNDVLIPRQKTKAVVPRLAQKLVSESVLASQSD